MPGAGRRGPAPPTAHEFLSHDTSPAAGGRAVTERRFGFVQWEFAGRLGPEPGRYPVRRFAGDDVRGIVVIGGYEAPRRTLLPRTRRARAARSAEPATVDVTRATVIDAQPLPDH